jgi:diguanylate cyclase (GGDEF)-like protein
MNENNPKEEKHSDRPTEVDQTATVPLFVNESDAQDVFHRHYRPVLLCLNGAMKGKLFQLEKLESTLGRNPDVELIIDDIQVSRRHLLFSYENFENPSDTPICYVEDLFSRNGTDLNGNRLSGKQKLSDQDRIVIGSSIFGFYFRAESDIHQQVALYESATRDSLTGLFNRNQVDQRLTEEVAFSQNRNSPLSLIVADIDKFKVVNDSWGHQIGDEALRFISKTINDMVGPYGLVGRWGGEEFIVILPRYSLDSAIELAESIRKKIETTPLETGSLILNLTVSFGLSQLSENDQPDDLFKRADECLYQAKENGRNQVVGK